jgi:hypothetical protein
MRTLLLIGTLCLPLSVHAYIDPSSGSFLLQMLLGSLIGVSFTLKMYFKTIKEKVTSFFQPNNLNQASPEKKEDVPQDPL